MIFEFWDQLYSKQYSILRNNFKKLKNINELIPKLNIASLNFKFLMINRVSDRENGYETLFDVKTKIDFRMSSKSKTHFETVLMGFAHACPKIPHAADK